MAARGYWIWGAIVLAVLATFLYSAAVKFLGPIYHVGAARASGVVAPRVISVRRTDAGTESITVQAQPGVELFATLVPCAAPVCRTIFVLHGGPAKPTVTWDLVERAVPAAAAVRWVYLHQRGSGNSSRPVSSVGTELGMMEKMSYVEGALGLAAQIGDIERWRLHFGLDRVDIVGHSFGGFVGTLYAAEFPQRVRSLTLVAPAGVLAMPPADGGLFGQIERRLRDNFGDEDAAEFVAIVGLITDFPALLKASEADVAETMDKLGPYYVKAAALEDAVAQRLMSGPPTGGFASVATFLSLGVWGALGPSIRKAIHTSGATFPVQVVHAESDMQPEAVSREYLDLFPKAAAQFVVLPGSHHFPMFDAALAPSLADVVVAFMPHDHV